MMKVNFRIDIRRSFSCPFISFFLVIGERTYSQLAVSLLNLIFGRAGFHVQHFVRVGVI